MEIHIVKNKEMKKNFEVEVASKEKRAGKIIFLKLNGSVICLVPTVLRPYIRKKYAVVPFNLKDLPRENALVFKILKNGKIMFTKNPDPDSEIIGAEYVVDGFKVVFELPNIVETRIRSIEKSEEVRNFIRNVLKTSLKWK